MTEPAKKQGGIKDVALRRTDTYHVDPRLLVVEEGWNLRDVDFDPTDPEDLSLSHNIAKNGVKNALVVDWRDGKIVVRHGHRRRAATMYAIDVLGADIVSVPVVKVASFSSEADQILDNQVASNDSKAPKLHEYGRAFKRLLNLGMTERDIAERIGKSDTHVRNCLMLYAAPEEVQHMVVAGEVSASLAIDTLRQAPEPQAATENLQAAVATAKAAGKTKATAKHMPATAPRTGLKADLRDLIEGATVKSEGGITTLEITDEEHERLKKLLGL